MEVEDVIEKFLGEEDYSGWEEFAIRKRAGRPGEESLDYIDAELKFLATQIGDIVNDEPLTVDMGDHYLEFRIARNPMTGGWSRKVVASADKPDMKEVVEFGNRNEIAVEFQTVYIPEISVRIDPDEQFSEEEFLDKAAERAREEIHLGGLDGFEYQSADLMGLHDDYDLDISEGRGPKGGLVLTVGDLVEYSRDMFNHFLGYDFEEEDGTEVPIDYNDPENWGMEFEEDGSATIENRKGDRVSVEQQDDGTWKLHYAVGGREPETPVPGQSEFDDFYDAVDHVRDTVIAGGGWNG